MKPSTSTLIFQGAGDYTHFRGVVIRLNGDFFDFVFFQRFAYFSFFGGPRPKKARKKSEKKT